MLVRRLFPLMLLTVVIAVNAQSQSPVPSADQSANQQQIQRNQKLAQAATQVATMVDQNRMGEVWDGASNVTKQTVTRDAFVKQIASDRHILGSVLGRSVASVTYTQSDGRRLPPGLYANVAFATRFTNTKQTVRELVSFHFDNDHVWRVSGYTLR